MARMLLVAEIEEMLGKNVSAVGCCGMKDGVKVVGVFESYESGNAIVKVGELPVLVNEHTIKLTK